MAKAKRKKIVDKEEWVKRLKQRNRTLLAMYSSVTDCIVTNSAVMTVPVDDHMVHRGDGVFESFKCVGGGIYNLEDHLARLESSCKHLGLDLPVPLEEMEDIVVQTVHAGGRRDALVRLLVSRGQGTMGINPYDCIRPELYVVVYKLREASNKEMPAGVSMDVSKIPIKPGIFAKIKTCNYLPNVLMAKEAVDKEVDYMVALDEERHLAEGATSNIGIVTRGKELFMPPPERVLAGTTAERALHFANQLLEERMLTNAEYHPITLGMMRSATEIHIYGTTPNITPVTKFEGRLVFEGRPGPIAQRLFEMLKQDMVPDSTRLTKVF